MKHAERRRSGRKVLTHDFESLPPAAALAYNLTRPDYVALVCGSLDALPARFSAPWMPSLGPFPTSPLLPSPPRSSAPHSRSEIVASFAAPPLANASRPTVHAARWPPTPLPSRRPTEF